MKEQTVLSLSYGRIIIKPVEKYHGLVPDSFETYQIVNPGDIVIRTTDLQNDHTSLRIGIAKDRGIITSAYLAVRPATDVIPDFAFHFLYAWDTSKAIYSYGSGLRQNLDFSHFKRMPVPVPPALEQNDIVRFLLHAGHRIDRAIRAKKKVIAFLNEQKQSITCHAITRGVDKSPRLKPSVIPWVDRIPEHWDQLSIKRLLSSMDYGTSEASKDSGSIRILTMGNIQKGEVILPGSGGLDHVSDSLLLHHHDLLFTRTNGNPNLVGKVGIFRGHVSDKVSFASYLVRLRVKPEHNPEWLHLLLNSSAFWPFARSHALVNLQTNLNSTRYGQFLIPVPPGAEQARIAEWIATESKPLTAAVSRLEREIELMREYRTRLTVDVVTGKLDVRNVTTTIASETLIQADSQANGSNASQEPEAAEEEEGEVT
jgi:type I restriction enzyme, S subunit